MNFRESVENTWEIEAKTIADLSKTIDKEKLEDLMNAILNCKGKIITSGCGTSGTAGMKIAHTLNCVECPSFFMSPAEALHGGLGTVTEDDIVVLLSKGGRSEEIDSIMERSAQKGAKVVGITENEACLLAEQADIFIKIKVEREPDNFNMLATGSTIAAIALFDAVAIAITRVRGYDKKAFLRIHPSGDVGKRLADGKE